MAGLMLRPGPPTCESHISFSELAADTRDSTSCGCANAMPQETAQTQFCVSLHGAFCCFCGAVCSTMLAPCICIDWQSHGLAEAGDATAGMVATMIATANSARKSRSVMFRRNMQSQ